jgi:hypothetical protein
VAEGEIAKQALSDIAAADEPPSKIELDGSGAARYRWEITGDARGSAGARSGVYPPDPPPLRTWLAIIRTMLRDGHHDAAKRALTDLRHRHPDYRIPDDLRGLE